MLREYPRDSEVMTARCHNAFMKNKDETDPEKIEQLLKHGDYIVKELEALYMLKKYRTLKRRYYDTSDQEKERLAKFDNLAKDS